MFLKVEQLNYKHMKGTPFEVHALRDVNFQVEKGEFIGLIGSSGAGKTTLVQLLTGLIVPSSGKIFIEGTSVEKDAAAWSSLRKKMGIVFQHPEQQLFAETVFQDVAFGPRNLGESEDNINQKVQDSLAQVGLDYHQIKYLSPFNLSGGEMRRVALAGIIAMQPEALILDEPTAGLDPRGCEDFLGYIEDFHRKKGMTIIMVSHRMEEIARYAQRLLVLHRGELVLEGDKRTVFSHRQRLKEIGLELPQISLLMEKLRARGKEVRPDIFTIDEACKEITNYLRKGYN